MKKLLMSEVIDRFHYFDGILDPICVIDRERKILCHNYNFLDLSRFNARKIRKGKMLEECVKIDYSGQDSIEVQAWKLGGPVRLREISGYNSQEEEISLYVSAVPLYGETDEPVGAMILLRDMSAEAGAQVKFHQEEDKKKWMQDTFSKYVSADVLDKMLENPENISMGGEEKEITILFSDIKGFTSMSERMSPEEVMTMLNDYFDRMVDIIFEHEGTLNKFIGDAVMAMWGAPVEHEDHCLRAIRAGLLMQKSLAELNKERKEQGKHEIIIRIGINTGIAVAGNLGSSKRMEYTVIGDTVNLAQRLESSCPPGGVLISECAYELTKEFINATPRELIIVKGKVEPVKTFIVN